MAAARAPQLGQDTGARHAGEVGQKGHHDGREDDAGAPERPPLVVPAKATR